MRPDISHWGPILASRRLNLNRAPPRAYGRLRLSREANTFFNVGGGVRIDRSSQAEKHLGVYGLAENFYRFSVLRVIYDDPIFFKGLILTGGYGTGVKKAVVNIARYNDQDLQLPLPPRGISQGEITVASLAIHDARFDSNRLLCLGPGSFGQKKNSTETSLQPMYYIFRANERQQVSSAYSLLSFFIFPHFY